MTSLQPVLVNSRIRIRFRTAEDASIVSRALKPDDRPLPEGLEVDTTQEKNEVLVEIVCRRGLLSFLTTVDDVLRMASLAERTMETTRQKTQIY